MNKFEKEIENKITAKKELEKYDPILKFNEVSDDLFNDRNVQLPISIQFIDWDEGLYMIGGRPGAGKTRLFYKIAIDLLNANKKILMFSFEDKRKNAIKRFMNHLFNFEYKRLLKNKLTLDEKLHFSKHADEYQKKYLNNVAFYNFRFKPLDFTKETILKAEYNNHIVMIDYLQLMKTDDSSDYERHSRIADEIREVIEINDRTVIAIVQLNRDKEITQASVAGSSNYEKNADGLVILERMQDNSIKIHKLKDRGGDLNETRTFDSYFQPLQDV